MWIQECHGLYNQVLDRKTHKRTDPVALEIALSPARNTMQVGPEELQLIEEDKFWPYPDWWPKLSKDFGPIPLTQPLKSRKDKRKAVEDLLVPIQQIEVVSIVLRFVFPEEFGIMSPPVLRLLNVVPGPDSVRQYLRYLSVLGKLRERYQQSSGLKNIADYDMALWTAAHLDWPDDADRLHKEMDQDKDFQKIRLSNLMVGLGSRWGATIHERLLLARALRSKDHVSAAVIVARCYEQIIHHVGKRVGYQIPRFGKKEKRVQDQLKELAQKIEALRRGVKIADLDFWKLRNEAVHGENRRTGKLIEISKERTRRFLKGVEKLGGSFKDILPTE